MSELRKDPVVERWVIIAADRGRRPTDAQPAVPTPEGPSCPLCEGNERMTSDEIWALRPGGSAPDEPGWEVRVVPNKYPALRVEGEPQRRGIGIFDMMNGIGAHEVVNESPDHFWRMGDGPPEKIQQVLLAYQLRVADLYRDSRLRYCVVFRNYGAEAGATLTHPHSQIMAIPVVPRRVKSKLIAARDYYAGKERCIFCDVIDQELALKERIFYANESFVAMAPFASRFPFELAIYPREHSHDFTQLDEPGRAALSDVLHRCLAYLRPALGSPSYSFVLNVAPNTTPRPGKPHYWSTLALDYHWHIEILPRLAGTSGFEWGTGFYVNPVAPEDAAEFLRSAMGQSAREAAELLPGESDE